MPFVVFLGGFPSRCQNLSSGAIRPGGLLSYMGPNVKKIRILGYSGGGGGGWVAHK